MTTFRRRDGFIGEKQINIPESVLDKYLRNHQFLNALYLTYIGFYPKASFHFRERRKGCDDNILFYCLEGKGYYDTHLGSFELKANQFTILPAHHFHRYQADINDPWTIYWIHFSGNKLAALNTFLDIEQYVMPTPIKYDERLILIWEEMYNALEESYHLPNIGYANLCLYRFISLFTFPEIKIKNYHDHDIIACAIKFLKENVHKTLTVKGIAGHFCYSSSYFTTLFKQKTGRSPLEYFIRLKIQYTCQLLDQSTLKIKEIASRVGYDDPYYFSRIFKKMMGASPNEYRQKSNILLAEKGE
jgi:AraC-like DNA-binding protein